MVMMEVQVATRSKAAVRILGPSGWDHRVLLVTTTIRNTVPEDVVAILDGDHGIAVRTGLHCAPLVHQDLGTLPPRRRSFQRWSLQYGQRYRSRYLGYGRDR